MDIWTNRHTCIDSNTCINKLEKLGLRRYKYTVRMLHTVFCNVKKPPLKENIKQNYNVP